jgi:hypothetical protein
MSLPSSYANIRITQGKMFVNKVFKSFFLFSSPLMGEGQGEGEKPQGKNFVNSILKDFWGRVLFVTTNFTY